MGPEILGVADHAMLDQLAVHSGISIESLMENAGRQVANEIAMRWPVQKTFVLCGPGNNGGDGYVVASHLQARGYRVKVLTVGDHARLDGAAKAMRDAWTGPTEVWRESGSFPPGLYIDAVYGAGLNRAIAPEIAFYFAQARSNGYPVIAIDVPSGLHGDKAAFLSEAAWSADLTVTFFRRKPAHVMLPGRTHCAETLVVDIGIPQGLLAGLAEAHAEGALPHTLFSEVNPPPQSRCALDLDTHKYKRGHAVVVCGPALATGAARLAARAALRSGTGLVTIAGDPDAARVCAHHVTSEMVAAFSGAAGLRALLADPRKTAIVVGPGLGLTPMAAEIVCECLAGPAGVVLDADALTAFQTEPGKLFARIRSKPGAGAVMTPHDGEFERLFPDLRRRAVNKIEAARMAAELSGAILVMKGADTVIAAPDGRSRVNMNAPPWLATAGSGDVLAGVIGGLLAQGRPAYEAASAAVWLHGAAGAALGPGLIASDLPDILPTVLKNIAADPKIAL